MKRKSFLSLIAMLLTLVMLLAQTAILTACKKDGDGEGSTSSVENQETSGDTSDPGNSGVEPGGDGIKYLNAEGKPVASADFAESFDKFDIPAYYSLTPAEGSDVVGSVGFVWNAEALLLAVNFTDADKISVVLNNYRTELNADDYGNDKSVYLKTAFETMGTTPRDLGQLIPVSVTVENDGKSASFDGYAKLCDVSCAFFEEGDSIDSFDSVFSGIPSSGSIENNEFFGIDASNGIRFYDLYAGEDTDNGVANQKLVKKNISALDKKGRSFAFETDILINALPIYPISFSSNDTAYGLSFAVGSGANGKSIFFTLINSESGILLVVYGSDVEDVSVVNVGKKVGEKFHLSAFWNVDNDLTVMVDGKELATFNNAGAERGGVASNSMAITWQRIKESSASSKDDFDATFSNIGLYYDESESLIDQLTPKVIFGGINPSKVASKDVYLTNKDLTLDVELVNESYGFSQKAYWESSDEAVISTDGKVTPHATEARIVDLTAYILDENTIIAEKSFALFVKSEAGAGSVYMIKNDKNPFTGKAAINKDTLFTLDSSLNSVVYDMGEVTDVNLATVYSYYDGIGLINKNLISLYYSEDNVEYKYVENFSMYQTGNAIYFYNFNVEARYIKIHSTAYDNYDGAGRITNSLSTMMTAGYSDKPLLADGEFAMEAQAKFKNDKDETVYDSIASFTLEELGIDAENLKKDLSDIRFILDGTMLPHCNDGETFYVRIFELGAGEEVTIKILYNNDEAGLVADGNEVFEVQYGTKYGFDHTGAWECSIATMPNGDLLSMVVSGGLKYYRSKDGGLTWSDLVSIPGTSDVSIPGGGFIVDYKTGKVFYAGYYYEGNPNWICRYYVYESNDNGYTWSKGVQPTNAPQYAISYSNGITLSTADGEGPAVDYVYTTGCMRDISTQAFCSTAFYSKDGGKSWTFSNSRVEYTKGASNFHEGGLSEETVWEKEDGTLIFYARCQIDGVDHFAMSYSKDHGVTWSQISDDTFTNIYTVNTQPIVESLDGTPVFMWGGNNTMGGRSYMRFPLNLAYSEDDGETFVGILDASFQTTIAALVRLHTNPDLTFGKYKDIDMAYIVSTSHEMYIINADDYLYKTKGGYDSFEGGVKAEGWLISRGLAVSTEIGATDGKYAMYVGSNSHITRSVPYAEEGSVSFDLNVGSFGDNMTFELQSAYNDTRAYYSAPLRIISDSEGKLYYYETDSKGETVKTAIGLSVKLGDNKVKIDFDGNSKSAKITVNGETKDLKWYGNDNYIGYVTIWTGDNTGFAMDRLAIERKDK